MHDLVHTRLAQARETAHTVGLIAQEHADETHAVDADIHERPAELLAVEEAARRVELHPEEIVGMNHAHFPNTAIRNQLAQAVVYRQIARPKVFGKEKTLLTGEAYKLFGLLGIHDKRLFAEHRLTRKKRLLHELIMRGVQGRDINRIDATIR